MLGSSEIEIYKKSIEEIFASYEDEGGFISYYMAEELRNDLYYCIDEIIVRLMMRYEKYDEAFTMTSLIMKKMNEADIDDSDGITLDILYCCKEIIQDIEKNSNDILRHRIFEWTEGIMERKQSYDILHDIVEEIWLGSFHENIYLARKKELILNELKKAESESDEDYRRYKIGKWLEKYFLVALESSTPEKEIKDMEKRYWYTTEARKHAVMREMLSGDLKSAENHLKESRLLDKDYPGLVIKYTRKLIEIYEKTGDKENIIKELTLQVTKYDKCNVDSFRKLKSYYDETQWEMVRKNIFKSLEKDFRVADLYAEEEMYDMLLEHIESISVLIHLSAM